MKRLLLIFALCAPALAEGPKFKHKDPFVDQEFTQVYNDIRHRMSASAPAIVQVVMSSSTVRYQDNRNSFQNTNLSASITPTDSTHKILVMVSAFIVNGDATAVIYGTIARDGSNILAAKGQCAINGFVGGAQCSMVYLDTPNSTSSLTYSAQARNSDNATTYFFGDTSYTQSIVLIELAL